MTKETRTSPVLTITVVIPTYHDWKRLQLCVDALAQQSFPKENFEVIVVNNDPFDPVPADFQLPANCIIIHEAIPGSYAARNAAIRIAKGEILAFTDSDCIPDRDWLKNGYRYFEAVETDRVGGSIHLFYLAAKKTMAECYEGAYAFRQKKNVEQKGVSVTANLFVRSRVFNQIGVFDEVMSGGDIDWNKRASKKGIAIMYGEDVIINHPARHSLEELKRKKIRVYGAKKIIRKSTLKDHLINLIYPAFLFYNVLLKNNGPIVNARNLDSSEKLRAFGVKFLMYKWILSFYLKLLRNEYLKS